MNANMDDKPKPKEIKIPGQIYKYFHSLNISHNKRPMGHIAHLRKQFKSINTYDYIITLIRRRKNPLLTL